MRKILHSQKGFSLAQVVIGAALMGVVALAIMKQVSNSQRSLSIRNNKVKLDQFMDQISRALSSKKVCDQNFAGQNISNTPLKLVAGYEAGSPGVDKVLIEKGKTYLADSIKVINITTSQVNASQFQLTIIFNKENEKSSYSIIRKNIVLTGEFSGGQIQSCFADFNAYATTAADNIDSSFCVQAGMGVETNGGNCYFKQFDQTKYADLNCASGYAITSLTYDPASYTYVATCTQTFTPPSSCSGDRIKSISLNGQINCLQGSDLADTTATTFKNGYACKLAINSGKLAVVCGGGSACTEGAERAGTLITQTTNTTYCSPYRGDVWKYKREKCIGGNWVAQSGSCWRRTQEACDPGVTMPPSNSDTICVTNSSDPCPDTRFRVTTANGTFDFCSFHFVGGGCFVAGTEVAMADGSFKNIEEIHEGDQVLNSKGQPEAVVGLKSYAYTGKIYGFNGMTPFFTPNHPFMTLGGWKSLDPEQSMKESGGDIVTMMKVGDILMKKDGTFEVIYSLDAIEVNEPVYNFEVTGSHEYIANDYIVHNIVK